MSKERPIIFSGPMVRAILEGRKTQTRRVVKMPNDASKYAEFHHIDLLGNAVFTDGSVVGGYGKPGDHLWVRETWAHYKLWQRGPDGYGRAVYKSDGDERGKSGPFDSKDKWRPSIHMPRWASRITLEVVSVRVERLQDIGEEDAKAEGVDHDYAASSAFAVLWESIKGPGSWDANPWIWVVEFKRI